MLIAHKTIWTPDNSHLLKYKELCELGTYIIGEDLKTQLNNLAEDLKDDEYYYDTWDAFARMHFMEHCVRLTKSPFYNKPMVLMDWQKAFIEASYSFKMAETGFDRFKRILLEIARKNTKSETCSALGLAEFNCGNEGADIVCSSNDDNQASITYDAIDLMRLLIDPKEKDSHKNQRFITNLNNGTKIFKLSDRTRNKEGRNIDFAIVDEVHEMQTNVIVKSIEQSQSLKDNPKLFLITTEGFVVDGFLDEELKKAHKAIYREDYTQASKRRLDWLYTQDSETEIWTNRKSWQKSNPTLGIVKKWDYLDEQVELAKESKADRIFVLSKDFNIKQNSVESWLNLEDYEYKATYDIEDFRGAVCLGMVDLAETTDLCCAKVLLMKPDDSTKYIYTQYFIPQRKLEVDNDDHKAGAKYKEWATAGHIHISDENEIDITVVADWFYKTLYLKYDIKLLHCGYDQRFSKDLLTRMSDYGWTKEGGEVEMVLQNAETLNSALRLVEADLKSQLINYNENPVDRFCFKNSCLKVNDKRQALCIKTNNENKIDGSVTLIGLYEMYRRYKSEFTQYIKKGGAN
jgi:phage terminase large subunit-like protein